MRTIRPFSFVIGWSLAAVLFGQDASTPVPWANLILYPRTDLNMVVEGIPLDPGMGLSSWIVLVPLPVHKPGQTPDYLALGKMVVLEQEASEALAGLKHRGFKVEANVGPFLNGSPFVEQVYFSRQGPQALLEGAVRALGRSWARVQPRATPTEVPLSRKILTPAATPNSLKGPEALWPTVEAVLGPGVREGKVLQYHIPRGEAVLKEGAQLSSEMGVGTEFHFQKVEGLVMGEKRLLGTAPKDTQPVLAVTGQFALLPGEVAPVRAYLAKQGVKIWEAQNHWTGVSPRLSFMDFWAVGRPTEVAQILKEALAKTTSLQPAPNPAQAD